MAREPSTSDPYQRLTEARTERERLLAERAEIRQRRAAGDLLDRQATEMVAARSYMRCAQALRSLPDDLERRAGLSADQVETLIIFIDDLTQQIFDRLNALTVSRSDATDT